MEPTRRLRETILICFPVQWKFCCTINSRLLLRVEFQYILILNCITLIDVGINAAIKQCELEKLSYSAHRTYRQNAWYYLCEWLYHARYSRDLAHRTEKLTCSVICNFMRHNEWSNRCKLASIKLRVNRFLISDLFPTRMHKEIDICF